MLGGRTTPPLPPDVPGLRAREDCQYENVRDGSPLRLIRRARSWRVTVVPRSCSRDSCWLSTQ